MKKLLAIYVIGLAGMLVGLQTAKAATIAHWTFEEGVPGASATGAGSIIDVAGGSNGTANNGPVYVDGYKTGFGNQGLRFNGSNQNVLIPNSPGGPLELSGSFTIEIALETATDTDGGFALFMGGDAGGQDPYYVALDGAGNLFFQMYFDNATAVSIAALGALEFGEFQHIAAVFDTAGASNEMRLYVDETLVGSTFVGTRVAGYDDPTNNLWLGSVNNGAFGFFTGVLADVRISDEALGANEFLPVPEPGMIAIFGMALIGLGIARRRRI